MIIPSEIDIHSPEGLTRLFRFAITLREDDADTAALQRLEKRFGLPAYDPQVRGALEDLARQLDKLGHNKRFDAVCALISDAIDDTDRLDSDFIDDLIGNSLNKRIVRFSFAPALLPCLLYAHRTRQIHKRRYFGYTIRYSSIGPYQHLMAFSSLFLDLPIYTESNPPWDADMFLDDDEPNSESPDLEITFPPAVFRSNDAPQLEISVRKSQLPRAVDRGKYDLESVMLAYLCDHNSPALAFVSETFLVSPTQSRLSARQRLLESRRISRVAELSGPHACQFVIQLGADYAANETIQMVLAENTQRFTGTAPMRQKLRAKSDLISIDEIQAAGGTLKPARYLERGPTGGIDIASQFRNATNPAKYRLADLFDIIRPKTTKDDPVGTLSIHEISGSNISKIGVISGSFRKINVRATLAGGLEEQSLKPGDILFAHRGPIGRVAYVTEADLEREKIWAAQTVFILRPRKRTSHSLDLPYCDPKVLFMYLLTPSVQESWQKLFINKRSPTIPIGEIERFALPENLLIAKTRKKARTSGKDSSTNDPIDNLLAEFQNRQDNLMKLREIEASMNDGLKRVWKSAWTKT